MELLWSKLVAMKKEGLSLDIDSAVATALSYCSSSSSFLYNTHLLVLLWALFECWIPTCWLLLLLLRSSSSHHRSVRQYCKLPYITGNIIMLLFFKPGKTTWFPCCVWHVCKTVRACPSTMFSMWPCKNISHIQVGVIYFFPTPPLKLSNLGCK